MALKIILMMLPVIALPIVIVVCLVNFGKNAELEEQAKKLNPIQSQDIVKEYNRRIRVVFAVYAFAFIVRFPEILHHAPAYSTNYGTVSSLLQTFSLVGYWWVSRLKQVRIKKVLNGN